jgi:hypothetical protein
MEQEQATKIIKSFNNAKTQTQADDNAYTEE